MTDAAFWDKIAPKYVQDKIADMPSYEATRNLTREYLKPTDTVLELGAGSGMTARFLADAVASITASDISSEMTRISAGLAADEHVQNLTAVTAPVDSDQFGEAAFDAILAFNLLHLLDDLPRQLTHIHTTLKPGGIFISKTICLPEGLRGLPFRLMLKAIPLMAWFGKAPSVVRITPVETLEAEIEAAGFQIIEAGNYPANPPRRFLVAKKLS